MATRHTLDINAPVEAAFDAVEDPEKIKLWAEGVEEIIYPYGLDEQNRVGTRFTQRIREGGRVEEYEGVVTAYDRPRHQNSVEEEEEQGDEQGVEADKGEAGARGHRIRIHGQKAALWAV